MPVPSPNEVYLMDVQATTRKVALYGKSLVMSSIGTVLQERPEFEIQEIESSASGISETPDIFSPDVILFDLAAGPRDLAVSLLRKHPTTMLIGVDLTNNEMLVMSGKQSCLVTVDDLIQVLNMLEVRSSEERWT